MTRTNDEPDSIDTGDAVVIHGLVNETSMNGFRGVVHGYAGVSAGETTGRYSVVLNSEHRGNASTAAAGAGGAAGAAIAATAFHPPRTNILPQNLAPDFPVGSELVLRDLEGASHLNGRRVRIVGFQRSRCRFIVETVQSEEGAEGGGDGDKEEANEEEGTSDEPPKKKQMGVHPRNLDWRSGTGRPEPRPVCEQRLVFSGPMRGISRLLDHSGYWQDPDFTAAGNNNVRSRTTTFTNFQSNMEAGNTSRAGVFMNMIMNNTREMTRWSSCMELWDRIQPFDWRVEGEGGGGGAAVAGGERERPAFRHELVQVSGLAHRNCFNPKCDRVYIPPGAEEVGGTARTPVAMKRCSRCRAVCYCDRECAVADWDSHRKSCRILEEEGVRHADLVTVTSPGRKAALASQRMVRLCVNAIASLEGGERERHLAQLSDDDDDNDGDVALLLYNVLTVAGDDVTNNVLCHLLNPPPPGREATVGVAFNSLGNDGLFGEADVQRLANAYECSVEYLVKSSGREEGWQSRLSVEPQEEEGKDDEDSTPGDVPNMESIGGFINGLVGEGNWNVMAGFSVVQGGVNDTT